MRNLVLICCLVAVAQAITDKVCIGQSTGEQTSTVDSLSRTGVPVTGHIELNADTTHGYFCNYNGGTGRDKIDPSGTCSNLEVVLQAPTCDRPVNQGTYHIKQPLSLNKCYPTHRSTDLRHVVDLTLSAKSVVLQPVLTGAVSDWGAYTAGSTSSCRDLAGTSSFYGVMHWLVPTTKGAVSPKKSVDVTNSNCQKLVVIYGMFHPGDTTSATNIYGVQEDTLVVTSPTGTVTRSSIFGPFAAQSNGNIGQPQTGRMSMWAVSLNLGETVTFSYGNMFLAPKQAWCLTEEIPMVNPEITNPYTNSSCSAECLTPKGTMNRTKPFQRVSATTWGKCPFYHEGNVTIVNGTEVKPKIATTRGLFGAIAGFIEGGWEGMKNGWYGYGSQGAGTGTAADFQSTQKAVDKITGKINQMVKNMNSNFNKTFSALSILSDDISKVDQKVNDLRADSMAFQIKQLVLLTNERILDDHDLHVQEMLTNLSRALGPSAKNLNNGCFEIRHQCNQTCLDSIANRTYVDTNYLPQDVIDQVYLGKVKLTLNPGWQDPLLIATASTVAAMWAVIIALGVMYLVRNGNVHCNICL